LAVIQFDYAGVREGARHLKWPTALFRQWADRRTTRLWRLSLPFISGWIA